MFTAESEIVDEFKDNIADICTALIQAREKIAELEDDAIIGDREKDALKDQIYELNERIFQLEEQVEVL